MQMHALSYYKLFLLALVAAFLQPLCLTAQQDYHPFPNQLTYLYSFPQIGSTHTWLFAAKVDSVRAEGQDSAYYLYRIDRKAFPGETATNCLGQQVSIAYATNQDHYFGKKMLRSPDGDCRFISSAGDTFLLKTLAAPGQSWGWSDTVTATVDSVRSSMVLSVMDSVKHISLSNGQQIALSKTLGFVQTFSFLPFVHGHGAASPAEYSLWGVQELAMGGSLPGLEGIFDFQPGDKVGYYFLDEIYPFGGTTVIIHTEVVFNNRLPGPDPSYEVIRESYRQETSTQFGNTNTYYPPSTDTNTYPYQDYAYLDLLPHQHFVDTNSWVKRMQSGVRLWQTAPSRVRFDIVYIDDIDTCAQGANPPIEPYYISYATGLGTIRWEINGWDSYHIDSVRCFETSLGNLDTCPPITAFIVGNDSEWSGFSLSVGPNPADDMLHLRFEGESARARKTVRIVALDGRVMQASVVASASDWEMDTRLLPQGIYLLQVEPERGRRISKRISIIH